jgi:predicted Zn finger-like uncharacterized protein
MPIQTACPSCNTNLNVPEALVGKRVRCKACQTVFTAAAPTPPAEDPIDEEIVEEPLETITEEVPRHSIRQKARFDRLESEDEEDFEERPRRRRKRRSAWSYANALVKWPALGLQIIAYLGAAAHVGWVILNLIVTLANASNAPGPNAPPGYQGGFVIGLIGGTACHLALTFAWSGAVIKGARSMASLENYSTAMTGCIVAMIPCNFGWCMCGLPFGIWGLVVLLQEDVKKSFR